MSFGRDPEWSSPVQAAALLAEGPPVVVRQPAEQWVASGGSAQFTINAVGPGTLSFSWLHDGLDLADGGGVSGAKTATLTLRGADLSMAGNYSVRVSSQYGTIGTRTAKLRVLPSNDNLAGASPLATLGGRTIGDNRNATKETKEPDHAGDTGGSSVWYQWIPGVSGTAVLDTWGSLFDTLLAVYRGTNVAELALVAANDDGLGFLGESEVSFQAEAGVTYSVAVDGYQGADGQVVLNWSFEAPILGATTVREQAVQLQVEAPARSVVVIEASEDLRRWVPVATNMVLEAGLTGWEVPVAPGEERRFFRALRR